ncbi:MAG: efflux RND transporter periplasmic adaptor subunit [Saprospiraceae bacterium]|nr:efflux RND transporter periplasmic adaptor subunit [Saprospiraceae bacterium]
MKKYTATLIFTCLVILFQSCGSKQTNGTLAQKQKELDNKVAQKNKLESEIEALEKEIAALDTSKHSLVEKYVGVETVKAEKFKSHVEVMGKIDVANNAFISAMQGGTATKIYVREGDYVKVGQTLAQLDDEVMIKSMMQAKHAVNFATELYNKQKALWDQKIGSEVQYLNAKNNMESAQNQLNTLIQQKELMKIKAIYPGVVDQVAIKIGQLVSPGVPAFRIVGTKGLKFNASIPESYSGKIKQGNSVRIYLPDLNEEVTGIVTYISKVIDPMSRTIAAEIKLPDNRPEFKTNMVGILRITDYNKSDAIVIPIKNLLKNQAGYYVYVAVQDGNNTIARMRPIKTGAVSEDKIEVIDGLKSGDQLITVGFQNINDGDNLIVQK